jgi:hypothetical protein
MSAMTTRFFGEKKIRSKRCKLNSERVVNCDGKSSSDCAIKFIV